MKGFTDKDLMQIAVLLTGCMSEPCLPHQVRIVAAKLMAKTGLHKHLPIKIKSLLMSSAVRDIRKLLTERGVKIDGRGELDSFIDFLAKEAGKPSRGVGKMFDQMMDEEKGGDSDA